MEQLADLYAQLKGTKVIASRIEGNSITFVLESGAKLTMSTRQLEEEIAGLSAPGLETGSPAAAGGSTPEPPKDTHMEAKPKKGRKKP